MFLTAEIMRKFTNAERVEITYARRVPWRGTTFVPIALEGFTGLVELFLGVVGYIVIAWSQCERFLGKLEMTPPLRGGVPCGNKVKAFGMVGQ
jgi:hypothetical protein